MTKPVWYKVVEHRVDYDDYGAETVVRTVYRDFYFESEANCRADDLNLEMMTRGYEQELWYTVEIMD